MSVLKRAIIKTYDAGAHEASVQVVGSLAVWLGAVPVATDIPAAEVVAGRECSLLMFTDDNPADSVIITVHGAKPADDTATRRVPLVRIGATDPSIPTWPDAATKATQFIAHIMNDYAGGDVTIVLRRRASAAAGTAVMNRDAYRLRAAAAFSTLESAAAMNFAPGDTNSHDLSWTYAAASIQAGDTIRIDIQRLGADGADDLAGYVNYDGGYVQYARFTGGQAALADTDGDTSAQVEASPDEDKFRLTIAGTLRYLAQGASPHHQFTGDVKITGALNVHKTAADATLTIQAETTDYNANLYINSRDGAGALKTSQIRTRGGGGGGGLEFLNDAGFLFTEGANVRLLIDSAGNVGIGTSTPTVKLDITGDMLVTGALLVNTIKDSGGAARLALGATNTITGDLDIAGGLDIAGTMTMSQPGLAAMNFINEGISAGNGAIVFETVTGDPAYGMVVGTGANARVRITSAAGAAPVLELEKGAYHVQLSVPADQVLALSSDIRLAAGKGLVDSDSDTKIQLEESADEDKIRFDVAAVERLLIQATSPHVTVQGDLAMGGLLSMGGNTLYGGAAAWGWLTLDSTTHASKGRVQVNSDLQLNSDKIKNSQGNDTITFSPWSPNVNVPGTFKAVGGWYGEFKLEVSNAYDPAISVRGGSGEAQPRFQVRPGDATGFDGRWIAGFGPGGATAPDACIWRLAAGTLSLAGNAGEAVALLIGARAAPEAGYALELRDDFLLGAYYQDLGEIATPAAPAANRARLYAKDNGSGKTQLVALFPTGAEQVLATEP